MVNLFSIPRFKDTEKAIKAKILFKLIWGIAGLVTLSETIDCFMLPHNIPRWIMIFGIYISLSLILHFLIRKGYVRLASKIFVLSILIFLLGLAWSAGGINGPTILGLPVVVLVAGLLLTKRESTIIGFIAIISGLFLCLAKHWNILPASSVIHHPLSVWLASAISIGSFMLLGTIYLESLSRAVSEKNRELSLRKSSDSRLQSISDNFTGGLIYQVVIQPDGSRKFTYLSGSVQNIYGITPSEGINDSSLIYRMVHEEDIDALTEAEIESARTMSTFNMEIRINSPSGEVMWLSIVSTPKLMENGLTCWDGIALIITERKRAVEALAESKELLTSIVDSTNDLIWSVDPKDFRILTFNQAFSDHFLKTLGVHVKPGILPEELLPIDFALRWREWYYKALTDRPYVMEYLTHDGSRLIEMSFNVLKREDIIFGISVFGKDLTERKRAEEERAKLECQLNQTQKLDSLGVLAGGIAHDFNNLLGGIYGYIGLAREAAKDEDLSDYLSKAINTMDRARGLTTQLLTFAKGGAPVKKTDTLFPFVQETAHFALSGSPTSCHFDIKENLWPCNFDKNQIGQVIDNIFINARQAMPDGGIISVSTGNVSFCENQHTILPAGKYVMISIKDCGIGISKEILPRIFDPFYTTKPTGHGLGLATCYSIISRHGGCIDVESQLGIGTTFHIFLPASTDSVSPLSESPTLKHNGTGTFLVMDDEVVIRDTLKRLLESFGYNVICMENGNAVLNFFSAEIKANRKIAGMIFDLTIPGGMGGKETLSEIKNLGSNAPVFVVSGYSEDPVMANPAKYGFKASICKPFTKNELIEILNIHLTQQ